MSLEHTPWIAHRRATRGGRPRLFCFPYAGGGASTYRTWVEQLSDLVEICPVQLPGRETRLHERPFTEFAPLILSLVQALCPFFERPFAFFGHSMGALISFELARALRRLDIRQPAALLLSGKAAPHTRSPVRPVHRLGHNDFIAELRRLNGTPDVVLENPELMDILLPILRADFAVDETYAYRAEPPLACPIVVFGGTEDPEIQQDMLAAWREHTSDAFSMHMVQGDHFFINTAPTFLDTLRCEVRGVLDVRGRSICAKD